METVICSYFECLLVIMMLQDVQHCRGKYGKENLIGKHQLTIKFIMLLPTSGFMTSALQWLEGN